MLLAYGNGFKVKLLRDQKEMVMVGCSGENSIVAANNMSCLLLHLLFYSSEITLRRIDWGLENEVEFVRQLFKTRRHSC